MILAHNFLSRGIVINPYSSDEKEQVSVDLKIGNNYMMSCDGDWREVRGDLAIPPGQCVLIETKEHIKTPNDIFGLLTSKGRLAASGIFIANTKVDPLYDGHLHVSVFNGSNKKYILKENDVFCAISFMQTEGQVVGDLARSAMKVRVRRSSRILDFIVANSSVIMVSLFTVAASIIGAIITVKYGK